MKATLYLYFKDGREREEISLSGFLYHSDGSIEYTRAGTDKKEILSKENYLYFFIV